MVKDPLVCTNARAKVLHCDTNSDVMAWLATVKEDYKWNLMSPKELKDTPQKEEMEKNRLVLLVALEAYKSRKTS